MENNKTFEECMLELEGILRNLENRDISLTDAVNNYTKGLELSKECYSLLTENEKLVVSKMTEAGLEDFKVEN